MSQLQVIPQTLTDAARTLRAEQDRVGRTAPAIGAALDGVAAALPGAQTAAVAEPTAAWVAAAVRAAAAELATLAATLGAAATHYLAVEQDAAAGLERAGRRPA